MINDADIKRELARLQLIRKADNALASQMQAERDLAREELQALRDKCAQARLDHLEEVRAILSDASEQAKALATLAAVRRIVYQYSSDCPYECKCMLCELERVLE